MKGKSTLVVLTLVCVTLLVACGAAGEIAVKNVTANLTLPTETGALYMEITNNTDEDDALLGATVPDCATTELHQMAMEEDVMKMGQVPGGKIAIPAGETVTLQQGGLHVMCLGKEGSFAIGDEVSVTLAFEKAGTIVVTAEVVAPGQ